jgi:hypothetical protein
MKREIILKGIKILCFLLLISGSYMAYSVFNTGRDGFANCSQLGDCPACSGIITSKDGLCAWDGKIGKCRVPTTTDTNYVIKTTGCPRTTAYNTAHTDGIWIDPTFGCPTCPALTVLPANTMMTAQKT